MLTFHANATHGASGPVSFRGAAPTAPFPLLGGSCEGGARPAAGFVPPPPKRLVNVTRSRALNPVPLPGINEHESYGPGLPHPTRPGPFPLL